MHRHTSTHYTHVLAYTRPPPPRHPLHHCMCSANLRRLTLLHSEPLSDASQEPLSDASHGCPEADEWGADMRSRGSGSRRSQPRSPSHNPCCLSAGLGHCWQSWGGMASASIAACTLASTRLQHTSAPSTLPCLGTRREQSRRT